ADRLHSVHAAVVELDPLADPVGPRPEDHDARALAAAHLVACRAGRGTLPARVVVGRRRLELGGARVNGLVCPPAGKRRFRVLNQFAELTQEPWVDAGPPLELIDRR